MKGHAGAPGRERPQMFTSRLPIWDEAFKLYGIPTVPRGVLRPQQPMHILGN